MYAHKHDRRMSPALQSVAVLLRAVDECHPELGEHVSDVVELAIAVGRSSRWGRASSRSCATPRRCTTSGSSPSRTRSSRSPRPSIPTRRRSSVVTRVIGERIVAAAPALQHVAPIVRASHERWDGDGYPDGLRGEEIPVAARVVFACDALGAMIQERPYAPARPLAEALAELRRCAGTQFDPAVVDALVAVAHAARRDRDPHRPSARRGERAPRRLDPASIDGHGWFRTSDLSRVKRALSR